MKKVKDVKELRVKEGQSNVEIFQANYAKIFHSADKNLVASLGEDTAVMFDVIVKAEWNFNKGRRLGDEWSIPFFFTEKSVQGLHGYSPTRQGDIMLKLEKKGLIKRGKIGKKRSISIHYDSTLKAIEEGMEIRKALEDAWREYKARFKKPAEIEEEEEV
jgi:hypothetical protein